MSNFKEIFKKFLLEDVLSRLDNRIWQREEDYLNLMLKDILNTDGSDFIKYYNMTVFNSFELFTTFIVNPQNCKSNQAYLFRESNLNSDKSFGGYSPEDNAFYFNLFKFNDLGLRLPISVNDCKIMLNLLFIHPLFSSVLHHEIAHQIFFSSFTTLEDYLRFRMKDHMTDRDISNEEFRSLIRELYNLWKKSPHLQDMFKSKEGIEEFLDFKLDSEKYIRNLKSRLNKFDREIVIKRISHFSIKEIVEQRQQKREKESRLLLETMNDEDKKKREEFFKIFNSKHWITFDLDLDDLLDSAESLGIDIKDGNLFKDI